MKKQELEKILKVHEDKLHLFSKEVQDGILKPKIAMMKEALRLMEADKSGDKDGQACGDYHD